LTNPLKVLNCPASARIEAGVCPSTRLAQPVPLVIKREGADLNHRFEMPTTVLSTYRCDWKLSPLGGVPIDASATVATEKGPINF